jgi:Protein of unknown function (DUF1559)
MARFQCWMAAWACVGMLIGPARECCAAEPSNGAQRAPGARALPEHLDRAFIPGDAVSVIVVHPQALLSGADNEWIPVEIITAAGMKEAGFDPLTVAETVALFAPPARGSTPDIGAILRFSKSYSKVAVVAAMRGRAMKINGQDVIEVPGPQSFFWSFPDDKTIVGGTEDCLKKMLTVKEADSPLLGLLKSVDVSGQLTAVFSIDAVRPIMKQAIAAAPPVPPPFQDFLKAPDLLSAIVLKVDAGEKLKANLTLHAVDEASAAEAERIVNQGLAMGRTMILSELASGPATSDPVEQAAKKYATRMINRSFDVITHVRNGQNVSIKVETGSSITTIGFLVALLLPAVQAARAAANRNLTFNKLRQIALSMMNYEDEHKHFPAHAIFSKDGKPLLSWRVAILPQLEEKQLYEQFHLDEPWDSEHNKALLSKMPDTYAKPGRPNDGKTVFLVPVGKGLGFEGTEGLTISSITDGTSHTILAVEVNDDRAVEWTKPDDLEVDLNKPLDGLGEAEAGGISGLVFFDGHTIGITKFIDLETLKALFTRNGREPINENLIR